MLFKIIICLLITYRVECKAWPDQSNRYDYYDPAHSWGNPYYGPDQHTTSTTTTTKPLYPTLFPKYQPFAPVPPPSGPVPSAPHLNDYDRQRHQDPVNPFNVIPLQPNAGENRYNGTNYNDNRPYDTTRATTYPPFDGRTKRPTLPTRVIGNTTPSTIRPVYNGTQHPINPTYPPFNQRPTTPPFNSNINQRPTNPTYPPFNNNPNQYHPTDPRNPTSNIGNFNHNFNDTRTTTYRPFQSADQFNQHGNNGNPYQNPSNYQPNNPSNYQPNNPSNYQPNHPNQNQNPNAPTYQPNGSNNPNNYNPSTFNKNPDFSPSGIALAPFPDINAMSNNNGGQNYFNNNNLQQRPQATNPSQPVNSRLNANGPTGQIQLAGYEGPHVPLA